MRILIVEDDRFFREVLRDVLLPIATELQEASTCAEALDIVPNNSFHCVTLDNHLPDGCGLDLIGSLRATGARIILLSGLAGDEATRREAHARGVDLILEKPFNLHALPYVVRRLCIEDVMNQVKNIDAFSVQ